MRHSVDMEVPTQKGRKIEVTRLVTRIALGGAPRTKESYSNDVLTLAAWRYLDAAGARPAKEGR